MNLFRHNDWLTHWLTTAILLQSVFSLTSLKTLVDLQHSCLSVLYCASLEVCSIYLLLLLQLPPSTLTLWNCLVAIQPASQLSTFIAIISLLWWISSLKKKQRETRKQNSYKLEENNDDDDKIYGKETNHKVQTNTIFLSLT